MGIAVTYPIERELGIAGNAVRMLSAITAFSPLFPVRVLALRFSMLSLVSRIRAVSGGGTNDVQTRSGFDAVLDEMRSLRDRLVDMMGRSLLCRIVWRTTLREWDELIEDMALAQDDELCGLVREIAAASRA